jgi:uncharacterized protein DUF6791/ThiF family protein
MTLVAHSDDLTRLVNDEYDIEVREGNLVIHHVPYVNSSSEVAYCILVSELTTNGEQTVAPERHEISVVGGIPHDHQGNKLSIVIDENRLDYGGGLVAECRLSGKPHNRMPVDYHEKITNYVDILGRFARAIDPSATHKDYPPRESLAGDSVFRFHDAASSRAGLSGVASKLKVDKVAIVGLGGTGSYILDLIAKTPINELHLFDDDELLAHNVFRAPGAASLDQVKVSPLKVDYFSEKYGVFRRNIFPHPVRIGPDNVDELREMDFVFLAMDAGPAKKTIIDSLREREASFIDCGMGLQRLDSSLRGTVRVTTGTAAAYDHVSRRISFADVNANEYDWNIQTADLNMLNAAMAVIKWKKLFGYYVDNKQELSSSYVVARNMLIGSEARQ